MRRNDWEQRFAEFVAEREQLVFSWGSHDCVMCARAGLEEITGEDCAPSFKRKYATAAGAALAMRRFAGGAVLEVVEKVAAANGWPEIAPLLAQRGDVVVLDARLLLPADAAADVCTGAWAVGLVDLDGRFAVVPAPIGLARVPVTQCARAWGVR